MARACVDLDRAQRAHAVCELVSDARRAMTCVRIVKLARTLRGDVMMITFISIEREHLCGNWKRSVRKREFRTGGLAKEW